MDEESAEADALPKTLLVPTRRRRQRNVLTRMHVEYRSGPLGVLRKCVEQRSKIKVWTRNYRYVRGICVGYLVAFDKHWNLALIDVDEAYSNPTPKPSTAVKKTRIRKKKLNHTQSSDSSFNTQQSSTGGVMKSANPAASDEIPVVCSRELETQHPPHQPPTTVCHQLHSRSSNVDSGPVWERDYFPTAGWKSEEKSAIRKTDDLPSTGRKIEENLSTYTRQGDVGRFVMKDVNPSQGRLSSLRTEHSRRSSSETSRTTSSRSSGSSSRHGRSGFEPGAGDRSSSRCSSFSRESSTRRSGRQGIVMTPEHHEDKQLPERSQSLRDLDRTSRRHLGLEREGRRRDDECDLDQRISRDRSSGRSRRERSEQMVHSSDKDSERSGNQREARLSDALDRLSVTSAGSKVKDGSGDGETEYQAVLTRHVNQLFIRGDNVSLVVVLG